MLGRGQVLHIVKRRNLLAKHLPHESGTQGLESSSRAVLEGRKSLDLCYMQSSQDDLIVAFPQNLLKEIKSILDARILSYFVHVLKEDI